MEILRNFELVELSFLKFKVMEAEAYIELFKKYIFIAIYGNFNRGEPNIECARENILRLNALSVENVDKFANALIDICNQFSDERGKEHDVFEFKIDVFKYIEPRAFEIISAEKIESGGYNSFIFRIEGEEHTLSWVFNDEDTIKFG